MAEGRRPSLAHPSDQRTDSRALANATILHIVPSLRDEPAARTAVEAACGLMPQGARMLVAGEAGPLSGSLQTAGGEWIPLRSETINPLRLRRNARMLERLIAAERIDIIHAHAAGAAWSALAAAKRLPVRVVTSLPDAPLAPGGWRSFYARALARGDRVIAPSAAAAGHAIARFDIPADRVAVIPRGVDTHAFDPARVDARRLAAFRAAADLDGGERVILVPGRIAPARGQQVLVEAAALLAERGLDGVVYVLTGDDRSDPVFTRALRTRIRKRGLEPLFRLTGRFRDLPAALSAAHLVVLPALEAPVSGRVAAQAQAMARPLIASDAGFFPEHLLAPSRMPDELRTGWLVPPGEAAELAEAIGRALGLNDTAYRALAARARQYAQFMFSPESVVSATRAVYTSLLARDR